MIVIGIYGNSNSGKTALIEKIVKRLTRDGYSVATVKHSSKSISIDLENKDTWRHKMAGALLTVFTSKTETDFLFNKPLNFDSILNAISELANPDVILVEGFSDGNFPKIAVGDAEMKENTVFRYKDNLEEILSFIIEGLEGNAV